MTENSIDLTPFQEYARLTVHKKALEAELKQADEALAELEVKVLESWRLTGLSDQRVAIEAGTYLLYRSPRITARPNAMEGFIKQDVVDALRAANLGHFVHDHYDWQTLDAFVRETLEQNRPLPKELTKVLDVQSIAKVHIKSGAKSVSSTQRAAANLEAMKES